MKRVVGVERSGGATPFRAWTADEAAPAAQTKRSQQLLGLVRDAFRGRVVREDGKTVIPHPEDPGDKRLQLWLAQAFLLGDAADRALANELIPSIGFQHADHFCGVGAAVMLSSSLSLLEPAAASTLECFLLKNFGDWMTNDYKFIGANDNAPLGCIVALSLGGQYFGNADGVAFARERLSQLDHVLDLRGYMNECNSPTYSSVSLASLSDLAEYSRDPETRAMALRAEQRLWQEVLLHFHPRLRQQVGPFARGYPDDNASQCTMLMLAYYAALGEIAPFHASSMLFPPPAGTFAHNVWDFQRRSIVQLSAHAYHPPVEQVERLLNRPLPFDAIGSNEFMGGWDAPGGDTTVCLHQEEDYGMGSFGSRLWAGQTVPLHVLYRRRSVKPAAPVEEWLAAERSVYTRMLVSDQFDSMRDLSKAVDAEVSADHAAAFSVQQAGTTLMGYVPIRQRDGIRTIRASAVFPLHHSRPDEIRFGDRKVSGFSAAFETLEWCFVRDGDVFFGIRPLVSRQRSMMLCQTKFADAGTYGLISFYNMCGFQPETLSREELRALGNGMVMEVGTAAAWGSFDAFIAAMRKATVEDSQYGTERWLRYRREGVELELVYDFAQLNLRRAVRQGKIVTPAAKLETVPPMALLD